MTSTVTPVRRTDKAEGARRGGRSGSRPPGRSKSASRTSQRTSQRAAQKAYSRRARRHSPGAGTAGAASVVAGPGGVARRIPFVALVVALLISGIGLTLWLTTSATSRSYEIAAAQKQNTQLENRKESLERVVRAGNSAPELADKAADLGMVQASDVARLVVGPDGEVTVEGEPESASGPRPLNLSRDPDSSGLAPPASPRSEETDVKDAEDEAPSSGDVLPPAEGSPREEAPRVLASGEGAEADEYSEGSTRSSGGEERARDDGSDHPAPEPEVAERPEAVRGSEQTGSEQGDRDLPAPPADADVSGAGASDSGAPRGAEGPDDTGGARAD